MADYTIISDVSSHILKKLREHMCPEPVPLPANIQIASPADLDTDFLLGVYLYDLQEEGEVSRTQMMQFHATRMRRPPRPYRLSYMLFVNGSSQLGLKAPEIQKIIGRAAQVINDHNTLVPLSLQPWLEISEPPILVSSNALPMEEKSRVWQAVNKPYQLSLFYKAAPVFLSSEIIVEPPRVTDAAFGLHVQGDGGGSP